MENREIYEKIIERARVMNLDVGDLFARLMDISSADYAFNLRLEDWLNADDFNFVHDWYGIINNINRNNYPSTDFGFFVPRFAGEK